MFAGLSYAASVFPPLTPSDEGSLRKVAVELKQAIAQEDVQTFLRHVSKSEGLSCTDRRVSYQQVQKDLQNKNSHLYMSLFDSRQFANRCDKEYPREYPAISDKEFFDKSLNEVIEISPVGKGLAQVVFKSNTKGHYPREWVFQKERGEWRLIEGFIVSRCSCG